MPSALYTKVLLTFCVEGAGHETTFLLNLYMFMYVQSIEMVEHDIPPEEREPVLEEPHKKKEEKEEKEEEDSEGERKTGEDQPSQPSEAAAAATDTQPSYAGVSTFFSGIASMVQTTVSSERDDKCLVTIFVLSAPCRVRIL